MLAHLFMSTPIQTVLINFGFTVRVIQPLPPLGLGGGGGDLIKREKRARDCTTF